MIAQPYWITSQLAIVPRPRGGDWLSDEMLALRQAGIDVVVSMLQEEEARELGLDREASSAQEKGLQFINFPVPDRGVPLDTSSFIEFLEELDRRDPKNAAADRARATIHLPATDRRRRGRAGPRGAAVDGSPRERRDV